LNLSEMKSLHVLILICSLIGISISCTKDEMPSASRSKFIYTNSFETASDIEEFQHVDFCWLSDTAMGAFGKHSAVFAGGCFYGHFNKTFQALDHDAHINVMIIAKSPGFSNHTDLYIDSLHYSLFSTLHGWQTIQFKENIYLPAYTSFTLSLTNQSGTYIDYLQVYEK